MARPVKWWMDTFEMEHEKDRGGRTPPSSRVAVVSYNLTEEEVDALGSLHGGNVLVSGAVTSKEMRALLRLVRRGLVVAMFSKRPLDKDA